MNEAAVLQVFYVLYFTLKDVLALDTTLRFNTFIE